MSGSKAIAAPATRTKHAKQLAETIPEVPVKEDVNDHLPPILLVFTVMVCSGFLFMYSFRDVFATGRTIGGIQDHAYLVRNLVRDDKIVRDLYYYPFTH